MQNQGAGDQLTEQQIRDNELRAQDIAWTNEAIHALNYSAESKREFIEWLTANLIMYRQILRNTPPTSMMDPNSDFQRDARKLHAYLRAYEVMCSQENNHREPSSQAPPAL